jgi:hypothetical protein
VGRLDRPAAARRRGDRHGLQAGALGGGGRPERGPAARAALPQPPVVRGRPRGGAAHRGRGRRPPRAADRRRTGERRPAAPAVRLAGGAEPHRAGRGPRPQGGARALPLLHRGRGPATTSPAASPPCGTSRRAIPASSGATRS